MRETENQLQILLCELAADLHNKDMEINVWDQIIAFEGRMHEFIKAAYDYQDNTFHSHPGYYIDYFEMRLAQLQVLHNLHYEIKKIRKMPKQALVIADYIMYMADDENDRIRSLITDLDFSENIQIPNVQEGMNCKLEAVLKLGTCPDA